MRLLSWRLRSFFLLPWRLNSLPGLLLSRLRPLRGSLPLLLIPLPKFLLLLHVSLNLGSLFILLLPLLSQILSLRSRPGLIILDTPGAPPFPVPIVLPALPVLLKPPLGDPFELPPVPVPIMLPIISPPTRVDIEIKTRHLPVITPAPVIISRAIPAAFPKAPPPAIPEKEVYIDVRIDIDMRVGYHYYRGRCGKYERRGQGNVNAYIYRCHCCKRKEKHRRQKDCSKKQLFHFAASHINNQFILTSLVSGDPFDDGFQRITVGKQ
jgi:hypothetical protein